MNLVSAGYLLFLAAWLIATSTLPTLERSARRQGLVDDVGGRKGHGRATPLTGGIAVLAAVALPAGLGLLVAAFGPGLGLAIPPEIHRHLPGILQKSGELLLILALAAVHLVLGYLDDRFELPAWPRLAIELGAGALLAAAGLRITIWLPEPWMHWVATMLFVAFTTNAVNFLDNMNGLMAGVVAIGGLHLLVLALATGQLFMAAILICMVGGLIAFLGRNFPHARVFIGDAGTLSLGFLLSALTVAFTFTEGEVLGSESGRVLAPFLLPGLILGVPLLDGLVVVLSRIFRGVHPFTAGHDHLSHRLVARGLSRPAATFVLWGVALLLGLPIAVLARGELFTAVWFPAVLIGAVTILWNWRRGPE